MIFSSRKIVNFLPMNFISMIKDVIQIEVEVNENAIAAPKDSPPQLSSGLKNNTSAPLQK